MEWKTSLKFNPKQSEEVIKSYIMANKEMFGITDKDTITDVKFNVSRVSQGYGRDEYDIHAFGGIEITITRKTDNEY
jgi:hypothetical protein